MYNYTIFFGGGIMNIVVDTSVIIAVIANEPSKPAIIQATQDVDLLAPQSVHWEIGNAFSAMFKRGRLNVKQALQAIAIYKKIPIRFVKIELEESLQIAAHLNIYAYDAYLIRCSQKYNAPLISLDKAVIRLAQQLNLKVIEVT